MKRKIAIIAALFCIGCIVAEPATDIKAAGIQVAAAQTTLSADNSLEVLSLSAGTLSPDFTGKTVQYTATVPNDVTSVTVTATPVNEFATVQSITGNDNLQVGTNTIKVVVKAQNGALAQYTITLTREEGQAADGQTTDQPADGTDGQITDQPSDGQTTDQSADGQTADQPSDGQTADQPADGTDGQNAETETAEDDDTYNMEYLQQEYNDLSEQYAKEKSFSRNMMGIMAFVIAVLVVIIVNLLLRGSKRDDWDDEENQDDWDWKSAKKVKDQEQQEDADFEENSSMEEENDIEQGGRNLSGGQKQRLTIARAVVKDPEILILDDSASALDFATDARLRAALRNLKGNKTIFIVSQRTSSIQFADQILVMDDGQAVGLGTHEELLENCEIYREIYESQFKKEDLRKNGGAGNV